MQLILSDDINGWLLTLINELNVTHFSKYTLIQPIYKHRDGRRTDRYQMPKVLRVYSSRRGHIHVRRLNFYTRLPPDIFL